MLVTNNSKFYLPQLDGLRFFAFFLVFCHHFMSAAPCLTNHPLLSSIAVKVNSFGWMGVDVFLCLSSFLLTTLMILEYKNTGNLSLKQFFIRRALRIWPLYYLIIFLSFVVFPAISFLTPAFHTAAYSLFMKEHLFPFSVFLGNFSYAYFGSTLTYPMAPMWTVSLEEQFYIFWPILLFILLPRDKKWFFISLTLILFISFGVRFYILQNAIPYPTVWVFSLGRLDPFALGALLSYLYLSPKFKPKPFVALVLAAVLLKLAVHLGPIDQNHTPLQLFAVDLASALLIYSAIYSRKLAKFFSMNALRWLGKISFGLYIFHMMVAQLIRFIMDHYLAAHLQWRHHPIVIWALSFVIAFVVTVVCAAISYYGFEKHFLKIKSKFTVIPSRAI
jgi:peptidoglycan/LPS O-acetylase OafA/YrhL